MRQRERHPARRAAFVSRVLLVSVPFLYPSASMADGGAIRLSEQKDNYQIAVFTAPTPLRAGPVDVTVLIQNSVTHELVSEVDVTVKLTRRDRPGAALRRSATIEAATNKLLRAATFNLKEPGWWRVEVRIDGPRGKTDVGFDMEAAKPLPKYLAIWPWLSWPTLPIALFAAHQFLVRRRSH